MTHKEYRPTIAQVRTFATIAEHGHFGTAAAHLGISQPSLSQALATLEGSTALRQGFAMPERPGRPVRQAVTEEAAWVRTHLAPWVSRRLRGVSSGDGLEPKLPVLTRVREQQD